METNKAAEKEEVVDNSQPETTQGQTLGADNVADESFESPDNSTCGVDVEEDWHDKYLRLVAEFDNYRKRTLREKMELIATGGEDVLRALLPVVDDFDRAMEAMKNTTDTAMLEGVVLIQRKLTEVLLARGVCEMDATGCEFDTELHEAVAKFPVEEQGKKGRIIDVVQKGYKHKERVLRHAKVVVGE